jgi:hypothetical protein
MNTSNPRQTHILWVKGGFRGVAPQASALARLRHSPISKIYFPFYHNELRAHFHFLEPLLGPPERPHVTKPLPASYKPVENTG